MKLTDEQKKAYSLAIGNQLKELRIKKGLSLADASRLTGYDDGNIDKIEKGKYNPSIPVICHYAKILGIDIKLVEKK